MILSVSRRTDIPAFYSEWFFNRLKEGFVYVRNPMYPKQVSRIELNTKSIDCIVFWTKDPKEMLLKLDELSEYEFYFHFTLNPYGKNIETNLPRFEDRIQTFIDLSDRIGKERVIWRYDPIILTNEIGVQYHVEMFDKIANILKNHTTSVVISILDNYQKIRKRMNTVENRNITSSEIESIAISLKKTSDMYGLKITSCAEDIDLSPYGINPGKCIDDQLISKLLGQEIKIQKDKNQRGVCGCVESIEIGAYNTCLHNCKYCYANFDEDTVSDRNQQHNVDSPFLFGGMHDDDKITERKFKIYKSESHQISLF